MSTNCLISFHKARLKLRREFIASQKYESDVLISHYKQKFRAESDCFKYMLRHCNSFKCIIIMPGNQKVVHCFRGQKVASD